jgi:hypothetical protein
MGEQVMCPEISTNDQRALLNVLAVEISLMQSDSFALDRGRLP